MPVSLGTWGFKSPLRHHCDVSGHRKPSNPRVRGFLRFEAGLVADIGVEGEVSDELARGLVHDSDFEVVDDEHDGCAFERPTQADVVHPTSSAE